MVFRARLWVILHYTTLFAACHHPLEGVKWVVKCGGLVTKFLPAHRRPILETSLPSGFAAMASFVLRLQKVFV